MLFVDNPLITRYYFMEDESFMNQQEHLLLTENEEKEFILKIKTKIFDLDDISDHQNEGSYLYMIADRTLYYKEIMDNTLWKVFEVKKYDKYDIDLIRRTNINWRDEKYLANATPEVKCWIDGLYEEASKWKRFV
jgi:hypothetical protein